MSKAREYWSKHLAAIATEGVTTKAYAVREGLPVTSLYYWRRRLKMEASDAAVEAEPQKHRFVAVGVADGTRRATCTVTVSGDRLQVELDAVPSPQWLAALTEAMR